LSLSGFQGTQESRTVSTPLALILRPNDTFIAVISVKIVVMNNLILITTESFPVPSFEWVKVIGFTRRKSSGMAKEDIHFVSS